jgi:hypothetical protein
MQQTEKEILPVIKDDSDARIARLNDRINRHQMQIDEARAQLREIEARRRKHNEARLRKHKMVWKSELSSLMARFYPLSVGEIVNIVSNAVEQKETNHE